MPSAQSVPVGTPRPCRTTGRAALLATLGSYARRTQVEEFAITEGASFLEIEKLTYFLQEGGQPLGIGYAKGRYGPHADSNLSRLLESMEGQYVCGSRSDHLLKLSPITLMPRAVDEAREWIEKHPDDGTADRVSAVAQLVTGFVSAYGVELLASVHWTATREAGSTDPAVLTGLIDGRSEHKSRLFTKANVAKAINHLEALGWVLLQVCAVLRVDVAGAAALSRHGQPDRRNAGAIGR
jgi:hypothetical protein